MDLNSVKVFVHVADKGSFTAAAHYLNVPIATVSRKVSELESSLNVRLLERSTRRLRLTEAGITLYDFSKRGLAEMDAGLLALQERENDLKGVLRLSLPPNFEPWWRLLEAFRLEYPNVEIDVFASERKVDLIEEGIDVSLRVGEVETLSSVAREVFQYRHKVVASPAFIEQFGQPKSPNELVDFQCAAWAKKEQIVSWWLGDEKVSISPFIRANDYPHMRYLALSGICITELPYFLCHQQLKDKSLVEILPDFPASLQNLSLLYPSRKQLSRISRVYIDFCLANFAQYFD